MNNDIKDAIKNNSLVLFVGAGMSIPFGFPNWTKLILNILENIKEKSAFNFSYHIDCGDSIDVFKVLDELEYHNYNAKVKKALYNEIKSVSKVTSQQCTPLSQKFSQHCVMFGCLILLYTHKKKLLHIRRLADFPTPPHFI